MKLFALAADESSDGDMALDRGLSPDRHENDSLLNGE